jgi:hypothetical protein
MSKPLPAKAVCQWQDWDASRKAFVDDGNVPATVRASIGSRRVTVWLPQGKVLRFNRGETLESVTNGYFYHRYWLGSYFRRIKIKINVDSPVNLG